MSMIFPLAFPLVLGLFLLLLVIVERLLPAQNVVVFGRAYVAPPLQQDGVTIIAINLGGALLPLILSLYLFSARACAGACFSASPSLPRSSTALRRSCPASVSRSR